ncbi:MAG TPA: multicopper oxidase domain-containing protein [Asanoa sp.]
MKRIGLTVAVVLTGVLLVGAGCGAVDTVDKVAFERPLTIPPMAESHVDDQGRRVFDLRAQPGTSDFGPAAGGTTATWGFNGAYLGPTLRATRGERVLVNVVNGLRETTSVHWHGMHLPAAMDGGPHQEIHPGATWSPSWTIDQPAATLWYHPHPHGVTKDHVNRGLAGMFILDDDNPAETTLPHTYGVDDIPVIIQDRGFHKGRLRAGDTGDTLLVDGTIGPYLDVTTSKVRLRLLNASTKRVYAFGFDDDRAFALVGSDGGLLAAPYATDRIRLSPGERAEVVVAVRAGERPVLRSYPPDLGNSFFGGRDRFDVLQLRAAATLKPAADVPATLADLPRRDPDIAVRSRSFTLSGTEINGRRMDLNRIDVTVIRDTAEVWNLSNEDGKAHSFHVHDTQFQVLSVDERPPGPELGGWKDTVLLRTNQRLRILLRFSDYTDRNLPYMFHCHLLMHEDDGMMGQFVVVAPGERAGTPPPLDVGHAGHG